MASPENQVSKTDVYLDELDYYGFESISEVWLYETTTSRDDIRFMHPYVPTAEDFVKRLQHEIKQDAELIGELRMKIKFGDIPDGKIRVAEALHSQINIFGKDPTEVVNDFLLEHGFEAMRVV